MYKDPKARDIGTEWFKCHLGVKQGDVISPTLFAIYIDDLVSELRELGVGIKIGDDIINSLLYADDIVLIAANEDDLQLLLKKLNSWCSKWRLEVNMLKTNVMHVRKAQAKRSDYSFLFEGRRVEYCERYKYLGITINEHLNFTQSVQDLCASAERALSGIISKMIKNKGFPFNVYHTLYEACVCSVADYASEVLGFHEQAAVEKLHNRAIRAFLGLDKRTAVSGMRAEMNWIEPRSRRQIRMVRMYHRLVCMPDGRLTKKVFLWDRSLSENLYCQTWCGEVKSIMSRNNLIEIFNTNIFNLKATIVKLKQSLAIKDKVKLKNMCLTLPKLRTYNLIADFDSPKVYLTKPLTFSQRRSLA